MRMSSSELVPLSLTFVQYRKGDVLGKVLALYSLLPMMTSVSHLTYFLLCEHGFNLQVLFFGLGVIVDHILNYVLKHIVQEVRPSRVNEPADSNHMYQEYGWPSSHCQFVSFYMSYLILYTHLCTTWSKSRRRLATLLLITLTVTMCLDRVYLEYHTETQCLWGVAIGLFTGLMWFTITHALMVPFLFPFIASLGVVQWLGLKTWPSKDLRAHFSQRGKKKK